VVCVAALVFVGLTAPAMSTERPEKSKLQVELLRVGDDSDVTATMQFSSTSKSSKLQIKIKKAEPEMELEIHAGGISVGTVRTNRGGSAAVKFSSLGAKGTQKLLDFDPREVEIEIEHGVETEVHKRLLTSRKDDGSLPPGSIIEETVNLHPTGVQAGASGNARLRDKAGRRDFKVEIEDVADGPYEVLVDGVLRGAITAVTGRGKIEFSTNVQQGKLPLDFDPACKIVQVAQSSVIVLEGVMKAEAPGASVGQPMEVFTTLAATSAAPGAEGHARFRIKEDQTRDFEVEIKDVPVGPYELVVGGTVRGTINVVVVVDRNRGEIEFSNDAHEVNKLPLDFDPQNQLIEVRQGATVFLSGTQAAGTPGAAPLVTLDVPLVNAGAAPAASGHAAFQQQTDFHRSFKVEVEDLPVGTYDLVVGGILRGAINVVSEVNKTRGRIEFEGHSDDHAGLTEALLLRFDPRGQLIEVKQGATLFLSVTMPN
jgi:hypothetical protein